MAYRDRQTERQPDPPPHTDRCTQARKHISRHLLIRLSVPDQSQHQLHQVAAQANKHTDIQTDRHTDRQSDIQTCRQTNIHNTYRHADIQADIQTYRQTETETDAEAETGTEAETETETETET